MPELGGIDNRLLQHIIKLNCLRYELNTLKQQLIT